jgi:pimeloyl-ACP methyl ester carboxylesterase
LLRVDLPGQGLTAPAPEGDHSAGAYAAVIEALVTRMALQAYVLVGTSFSAIPAALHAVTRPAGLAGLVMVTASGLRRRETGPAPNQPPPDPRLSALREGRRPLEFFDWKLRSLLKRPMPEDELAIHVHEAAVMNDLPGRTQEAERRVRAHDHDLLARTLPQVELPALVQWSSDSTYLPPDMATTMGELLPRCTAVHVYPRTGHLPLIDAPEDIARDVNRFLDALAGGRTATS